MASGGPSSATLQLAITNQETGNPVSYKQDGKRFASDVTLKFSVDTAYTVRLTIKPPFSRLLKLELGSDSLSPENTTSSEGSESHTFTWHTTGMSPSGSAKRHSLLLTLLFEGGSLLHTLQAKFYKPADTGHLGWGSPLHAVELGCRLEGDGSAIGKITDSRIR